MKCVIIVDHTLPVGLLANASAVLAMSIGNQIREIVGEDVLDGDGMLHSGITRVTVPVLKGDARQIRSLRERLLKMDSEDIYFVDFCDLAQQSRDYGHYMYRMRQTASDELNYLGLALCGPVKAVTALTGNLGLLR